MLRKPQDLTSHLAKMDYSEEEAEDRASEEDIEDGGT